MSQKKTSYSTKTRLRFTLECFEFSHIKEKDKLTNGTIITCGYHHIPYIWLSFCGYKGLQRLLGFPFAKLNPNSALTKLGFNGYIFS